MKKSLKICLIVAGSMLLAGLIVFGVGFAIEISQNTEGSWMKLVSNSHRIDGEVCAVAVTTNTADVHILPSTDGECRVECLEEEKLFHRVEVKDGVLTVAIEDTRAWYEHIQLFSFQTPHVKIYLPSGAYESLFVKGSTGSVEISRAFSFGSIEATVRTGEILCEASATGAISLCADTGRIRVREAHAAYLSVRTTTGKIVLSAVSCDGEILTRVSTGRTELERVSCKGLQSTGDTGDLFLLDVIAAESMQIRRSTGDVQLESCDAAELFITTSTGDVTGTLLSEKIFFAESSTGSRDVPHLTSGGRCEIRTSTGDIRMRIVAGD